MFRIVFIEYLNIKLLLHNIIMFFYFLFHGYQNEAMRFFNLYRVIP